MSTPAALRIDFVSDVSCPWCVIGLWSLEAALSQLAGEVNAEIHFQPFELNPDMGAGGENIEEHIARKYGAAPAQFAQSQEMIRARGAQLGFEFDMAKRRRIYNSFDAHRLLHSVAGTDKQRELKRALFKAYFTDGRDVSDHAVLREVAASAGLDAQRTEQILASNEFADEVRAQERLYQAKGIHAVPSVILDDRYLVQGGQPVEVFVQALRQAGREHARAPRSERA